ncbi:unnamed protein product, partial [marine sediment metagenome]
PQSKVKESKVNKTIYIPYPEFPNVNKITQEEHQKLIDMFGEAGARDRVENLSLYIASRGDKYKNHYASILAWEKRDKREKTTPISNDPDKYKKQKHGDLVARTAEDIERIRGYRDKSGGLSND